VQMLYDKYNRNNNVALGTTALIANTTGSSNVALGIECFIFKPTNYNVAIGSVALRQNTSGSNNVALGQQALHQIQQETTT
jgi:trimeric autotransporter adhesin